MPIFRCYLPPLEREVEFCERKLSLMVGANLVFARLPCRLPGVGSWQGLKGMNPLAVQFAKWYKWVG